jgi:hypothetical protein
MVEYQKYMMAKFVLILYVPGIPALSMSDIDFDFGGLAQGNHKKQPRLPTVVF